MSNETDEMDELREQIGPAWGRMSPAERVIVLSMTADNFAKDTNKFMTAEIAPGTEALEAQVAAVSAIAEILMHILIAETEKETEN